MNKNIIANTLLTEFGDKLEAEENQRVDAAIDAFNKLNPDQRLSYLSSAGYEAELTTANLREYFSTLDLMDVLANHISTMSMMYDNEQE